MELSTNKNENGVVSIGESLESRKFQVSVDSQLFMVLSAQIYSDRIMAPIRELCCNAYDSHITAGTDCKIDVHIPTANDAVFSVRDYGTGLSKDDVFNLYSSYGSSTKRDSNDQIGCLGLGSKSPLAYVNAYSVVSFYNGMRYEYVVQLKNGEPYCDLIQESETDEPNGLLVSFFVKTQDVSAFNSKATTFFRTFHDCVNFTGSNLSASFKYLNRKYDIAVPASNKRVNSYVRYSRDTDGTFVVMGGVAYAFNMEAMPSDPQLRQDWVKARDMLRKFDCIYVYVPIGSVDIAASRETVSPTDRTIKTVSEVVLDITDKLNKEYADKYKATFRSKATRASLISEFEQLSTDLPWIEVCQFKYEDAMTAYDDIYEKRWSDFFRRVTGGTLLPSGAIQYTEGRLADTVTQSVSPSLRISGYEVFGSNSKLSVPLKMLHGKGYVFVEVDKDSRVDDSRPHTIPVIIRHNVLNNYKYITILSSKLATDMRKAGFTVMKWDELEKPPRKERVTETVKRTKWESLLAGSFCIDGYWLEDWDTGIPSRFTVGKSDVRPALAIKEGAKKIAYIEVGVGGRHGAALPLWAGKAMLNANVSVATAMKHITSVVQTHLGIPVIAASPACARRLDKAGIGVSVFDIYLDKIKDLVKVKELDAPMISNAVRNKIAKSEAAIPIPKDELAAYCGDAAVAKEIVNLLSGKSVDNQRGFISEQLAADTLGVCYSVLSGESATEKSCAIREAVSKAVEFIERTYPLASQAIKAGGSTYYCSEADVVEYVELINKKRAEARVKMTNKKGGVK